jgi:predicted phage gp36 major capsid-like protein
MEIDTQGTAFVTGDGANNPKGFLSYTMVDDDSWSWGNFGYVANGDRRRLPVIQSARRVGRSRLTSQPYRSMARFARAAGDISGRSRNSNRSKGGAVS